MLVMSSCGRLLVGGLKQPAFGVSSGGGESASVVGRSVGTSVGGKGSGVWVRGRWEASRWGFSSG